VYGPVRTVVWQGSAGDRRPYADQTRISSVLDFLTRSRLFGTDLRSIARSSEAFVIRSIPILCGIEGASQSALLGGRIGFTRSETVYVGR